MEGFGDPWSLPIVRDLMFKARTTYTDFLRAEDGIATNVLADRLALLQQSIVTAERDPTTGRAIRHALTAKGIDLMPMMLEHRLERQLRPEYCSRARLRPAAGP